LLRGESIRRARQKPAGHYSVAKFDVIERAAVQVRLHDHRAERHAGNDAVADGEGLFVTVAVNGYCVMTAPDSAMRSNNSRVSPAGTRCSWNAILPNMGFLW